MKIKTPEDVLLIGTIVESYQRSGTNVVNVSIDLTRLDLEPEGSFDLHLGDKVAIEATLTVSTIRAHMPQNQSADGGTQES